MRMTAPHATTGDDRVLYRLSARGHCFEEADSLVMLATAYGKRSEWRPALNVLALALKLDETPD
jgi:hypothetical protein